MSATAEQLLIRVSTDAEGGRPPGGADPPAVSLAMLMADYHQSFGEVPRCIKGALQILLTRGKVKVQFGNGMTERFELNDHGDLLSVGDAIALLNSCEARLGGFRHQAAPE
jgi:hypothetical protein